MRVENSEYESVKNATDLLRLASHKYSDPGLLPFLAATILIIEFTEIKSQKMLNDNFLRSVKYGENNGSEYVERIISIGSTLFCLRNEPGFEEMKRRFREKGKLRSTSYESFAAIFFRRLGASVYAYPEVGKLTEDFDFEAHWESEIYNVEVSAFEAVQFSRETVRFRLKDKAKQLPDSRPAIIFLFYPQKWLEIEPLVKELIDSILVEFLTDYANINAVIASKEEISSSFSSNQEASIKFNQNPTIKSRTFVEHLVNSNLIDPGIIHDQTLNHAYNYHLRDFYSWIKWAAEL